MPAPLSDPAILETRRLHLASPHMTTLRHYAESLRQTHGQVPDADPADGGTTAQLLLLLETPGPRIGQTGIVSADNASGTGANIRRAFAEAGIARTSRVIWNTVPWVVHSGRNRALRTNEIRTGLELLPGFLALLPQLRVAVLSGRVAGTAAETLRSVRPGIPVLFMPHPSPTYVCTSPDIMLRIRATLAQAAQRLATSG